MKTQQILTTMAFCAALPVIAQTANSMTLYGIVDASVRSQTGLTSAYARTNGSSTVIASGVGHASRWGIRGVEDMGGGLSATFNLESGINVDTGAAANGFSFFDRVSVVGLTGSWGSVTLGRQNTLISDSVLVADPIFGRFSSLNPNIQSVSLAGHQLGVEYGTTGSAAASSRVNNSVKYGLPVGPLVARAAYSFGEATDSTSKQSGTGFGLDYLTPGLSVTTAYTRLKDVNDRVLTASNVGATWLVQPSLRLIATIGYNRGATSATADSVNRVMSGGANYAITPDLDLLAGYYKLNRQRTALPNDGYSRVLAYLEHKLSRRSKIYLELDTTRWNGNYLGATGNKATSNGVSFGVTHRF